MDDGTAADGHGEMSSTALCWNGSWRITVHRDPVGRTTEAGGFGHEDLGRRLASVETLRTPAFAGLRRAVRPGRRLVRRPLPAFVRAWGPTAHASGLGTRQRVVEQTIALLHWFRRL
ncbi:glycoside hydrolase clan GH-D [Streptomyces sp. 769]|nr:glycoside hydrolase clan GH-D [Streptomyces sp. 769]